MKFEEKLLGACKRRTLLPAWLFLPARREKEKLARAGY